MSNFSPNLRLELITTGSQAGTWGNTTNTNLGDLVESAIAGYIEVSIISANQVLTALDGAPDQSRHMTLELTTITGAAFNVYAPPAEKTYVVYNNSAHAATLFNSTVIGGTTAAGLGVTIPAGKTVTVWSDGTDFSFQNNHLASLTIAAPLAVTSGGTGVTTSTGTGSTVLSDSPTFTGTPASPTAAFGTNTTQLANTAFVQVALQAVYPVGSIYINAGVTTNPATLLGFGTWVSFGAGRVMVGLNGADPLFDTLQETGGSADAVLVAHTHTGGTDTAGSHSHLVAASSGDTPVQINGAGNTGFAGWGNGFAGYTAGGNVTLVQAAGLHAHTFTTNSAGGSSGNANLQPYITVAMWRRTA
jgi:hypothetical protein